MCLINILMNNISEIAFEVRESKTLNYILSAAFLAMFIGFFFTVFPNWDNLIFIPILLFVSSLIYFLKAFRNRLIMRIDDFGITYKQYNVCDWVGFEFAYLGHEFYESGSEGTLTERYFILITYFDKVNTKMQFKIPMINTQSKSEEDIMYAINEFSTRNKKL